MHVAYTEFKVASFQGALGHIILMNMHLSYSLYYTDLERKQYYYKKNTIYTKVIKEHYGHITKNLLNNKKNLLLSLHNYILF